MTHTPPSEAAASSPSTNPGPWSEATPERLDQAARALTYNGSQREGAAKHLLFVAGHRIEALTHERDRWRQRAEAAEAIAERNGKAATERGDLIEAASKAVGCKPQELVTECASRERMLVAIALAGRIEMNVDIEAIEAKMLALAAEVEALNNGDLRNAVMAFDGFLRLFGTNVSKLEGLMPVPWVIAAAKLLPKWSFTNPGQPFDPSDPLGPKFALPAEAQTAIAAMRDVGPELAKAGVPVGPRCSHAEAVAQLRGERDRWREKFEAADHRVAAAWVTSAADRLFEMGFSCAQGVRVALNKALNELTRLRKESKRDQVAKQQALLDEIARLFPGKGPLLDRVRLAAAVADEALAEAFREAGAGSSWASMLPLLERRPSYEYDPAEPVGCMENLLPKSVASIEPPDSVKLAEWPVLSRNVRHAREQIDKLNAAVAPYRDLPHPLGQRSTESTIDFACRLIAERLPKVGPATGLSGPCTIDGKPHVLREAVGPATGQPRTEVPVGPDGSGTVVELGEAFREEMRQAGPSGLVFDQLFGETPSECKLRHLHTAVGELAKVVERIGGAK